MKKYRRVEINAYRRRVTVVSGEWSREIIEAHPTEIDDEVLLHDTDVSEPVALDSPEGQVILVDVVRSLERCLRPEAHAIICPDKDKFILNPSTVKSFRYKLRFFSQFLTLRVLDFFRNRDRAAKQSAEH